MVLVGSLAVGCGKGVEPRIDPSSEVADFDGGAVNEAGATTGGPDADGPPIRPDAEAHTGPDASELDPDGMTEGTRDATSGSCNSTALDGAPTVSATLSLTPLPAGLGGTIVLGRYVWTDSETYEPPGGGPPPVFTPSRAALVVTATTLEFVQEHPTVPVTTFRFTSAYTVSGAAMSISSVCPSSSPPAPWDYTAGPDELVLYSSGLMGSRGSYHFARVE
jgi:hypothetical protein